MRIVLTALIAWCVASTAAAQESAPHFVPGILLEENQERQESVVTDTITVIGERPLISVDRADEWEVRDTALTTTVDDSFGPPVRITSRRLIGPLEARTTTTLPSTGNYQGPDFDNRVPDLAFVYRW